MVLICTFLIMIDIEYIFIRLKTSDISPLYTENSCGAPTQDNDFKDFTQDSCVQI